jgi:hypothetical protein
MNGSGVGAGSGFWGPLGGALIIGRSEEGEVTTEVRCQWDVCV